MADSATEGLEALARLGYEYEEQNDFSSAIQIFKRIIRRHDRLFGQDYATPAFLAAVIQHLITLYRGSGQHDEAEKLHQRDTQENLESLSDTTSIGSGLNETNDAGEITDQPIEPAQSTSTQQSRQTDSSAPSVPLSEVAVSPMLQSNFIYRSIRSVKMSEPFDGLTGYVVLDVCSLFTLPVGCI